MTPPMRRKLLPCLLASLCAPSLAAEVTTLPVVEVSASAEDGWLKPERATPSTVYRVGGEALGAFGNPGGTNPYLNLADLPGVKITPVDAYGLNNMQGGQRYARARRSEHPWRIRHGGRPGAERAGARAGLSVFV